MSDHDPLCQWANTPTHRDRAGSCPRCALIARVRAAERRRELLAVCECGCMERDAHAEAVAARLVEVIREQDDLIQIVGVDATNHRAAAADMRRERDAARAEVAALTRWKDEATEVIEAWERIHRLLGKPGFIGESKAVATYDEVRDLIEARGDLRAVRAEADKWQTLAVAAHLASDDLRAEAADLVEQRDYWHGLWRDERIARGGAQ